ncbi:MAG: polar amino acid transport system substrate-binding protein [Oceanospirillaceae bacterium]|jgi:polar amino acid transport system substrate-binding protein
MKLRRNFLRAATAALLAAVALSGTAQAKTANQEIAANSVIETIKKRGVIKVGLSLFKPWSMRNKKGELIGFELDVGRKMAKDMGVDIEFIPTAWDGIIPALVSGKFDVIISGMTVTPKRNLTVNFTQPYAYSGMTILANKQKTAGFKLEDYNKPEVTFSARRGATPAAVIKTMFPKATLLLFDDDGASGQEVRNGNAHATMSTEPEPSTEARRYPDTLYVPFNRTFSATGEAIALRKGDPDALNWFNNWIGINTRTQWLQERNDYWFKTVKWSDQVSD